MGSFCRGGRFKAQGGFSPPRMSAAEVPDRSFERALDELHAAREEKDALGIREAGEKAWLAVVEATDRFLARHGVHVELGPRAHFRRRSALPMLGRDVLRREYYVLSESLHGDLIYADESMPASDLDALFEEAARYLESTSGRSGLVRSTRERLVGRELRRE